MTTYSFRNGKNYPTISVRLAVDFSTYANTPSAEIVISEGGTELHRDDAIIVDSGGKVKYDLDGVDEELVEETEYEMQFDVFDGGIYQTTLPATPHTLIVRPGDEPASGGGGSTIQTVDVDRVSADSINTQSLSAGSATTGLMQTDQLSRTTVFAISKGLVADGTTDDTPNLKSIIEDNEGKHIVVEEDTGPIALDTQLVPSTSGERTVLDFRGHPTINIDGVSSNPVIDLRNAPNLTLLGPVTISGTPADGERYGMFTGDGFRFESLTFDGGRGAIKFLGVSDGRGRDLTVSNQHDTDRGIAGALEVLKSSDVTVEGVTIDDCDRGVEVDDNSGTSTTGPTSNVTVRNFAIRNINASSATNYVGYTSSLDVHNHSEGSEIRDVTFDDGYIENCQDAPSITVGQTGPAVDGIVVEDIHIVDSNAPEFEASQVTVRDISYELNNYTTPNSMAHIAGGNVTIDGFDMLTPNTPRGFEFEDGGLAHGRHTIRNIAIADNSRLSMCQAATNITHVLIENCRFDGDPNGFEGVHWEADTLDTSASGYGAEFVNCEFVMESGDQAFVVNETNAPLLVSGGFVSDNSVTLPAGSRFRDVDGITASSVGDEIAINGTGAESASAETPQGAWQEGDIVDFTDSGDGSGTGVYQLINGTWVAN